MPRRSLLRAPFPRYSYGMKRLLLAGSLALLFALSRVGARAEQDDAFGSLIGMADSASNDKGPQADLDEMRASSTPPEGTKPDSPAPASEESATRPAAPAPVPASAAPAAPKRRRVEPRRDDGLGAVAVPAASAPRVWTKLFSSLLPPMARVSSFEVSASTGAGRGRAKIGRAHV